MRQEEFCENPMTIEGESEPATVEAATEVVPAEAMADTDTAAPSSQPKEDAGAALAQAASTVQPMAKYKLVFLGDQSVGKQVLSRGSCTISSTARTR